MRLALTRGKRLAHRVVVFPAQRRFLPTPRIRVGRYRKNSRSRGRPRRYAARPRRERSTPVICPRPPRDIRSDRQTSPTTMPPFLPAAPVAPPPPRRRARARAPGRPTDVQVSGAEAQLALCEPDHLRRLEQPLKYGFADRSSARKGLEVAAGVAIADRLGSIRQTAGPPIGRHGYMAIVWLGSRWLQLEQPAASAVPFTQYRLLHDFGWEESGKNAAPGPEADAPQPPGGPLGGRGQRLAHRQEDPRGPLRDHRPGAVAGRPRRPPRAAGLHLPRRAGSSSSCATRPASTSTGTCCATCPPSPASSTACSRTTASRRARTERSGRPTGSGRPSSRASARPAAASATTWPR